MEEVKNEARGARTGNSALNNPMGYAPILPLILKMSVPTMFAMLITALYNIVDSIYVSKYSETALSAVSLVYPIQLLATAVYIGTGIGILSLISRRLGEKNIDAAQSAVSHGIIIANLEYLIFLAFGLFGSRAFCLAFSKSAELVDQATTYCSIVCIGSIFIFNAISGERIMQACGNMMYSMICQLIGSVTNIILDPIMIFGKFGLPAMGVAGAAYATIIGQFFAMLAAYIFLYKGHFPIKIDFKGFKVHGRTVKDIYDVAIPSMVIQAIGSLTVMIQNKILIGFSDTAVAVLGAYFKLQSFVFMPVFGLSQGTMPIMGFNYGAKNKERLMNTLKYAVIIAVGITIIGSAVCKIIPGTLMSMFNASDDMMEMGIQALRTISWGFPLAALGIIPGSMFQATAHGYISMFNAVLRQVVIIIPVAYFLSKVIGVAGVWWSYPCSECASVIFVWSMLYRLYKKELQYL